MRRPNAGAGWRRDAIRSCGHRTRLKNKVDSILHAHLIPKCRHANLFDSRGRATVLRPVKAGSRCGRLDRPCARRRLAVLERACKQVRFPATIRIDQGSVFVSRDLDLWAYQRGVTLDFSRPGKPTIEVFNGRFRVECLNAHWFLSFADNNSSQ